MGFQQEASCLNEKNNNEKAPSVGGAFLRVFLLLGGNEQNNAVHA